MEMKVTIIGSCDGVRLPHPLLPNPPLAPHCRTVHPAHWRGPVCSWPFDFSLQGHVCHSASFCHFLEGPAPLRSYRFLQRDSSGSFHVGRRERGRTQISLRFGESFCLSKEAGLCSQGFNSWGPAEGLAPRISQGRPKRVMRKACALSTAQPLASLPGYFYFLTPTPNPCRAEAQAGRFSAPRRQ